MKIYSMKAIWDGEDNVFKDLRPMEPSKWGNETLEKQKRGEPLEMKWADDSSGKPRSDFVMFPSFGLCARSDIVEYFRARFAPTSVINKVFVSGEDCDLAFLKPKNYDSGDSNLEHIFMMFWSFKSLLVTQVVKDEWERQGLTGAVFEYVTEMDDSRFNEAPR